MSTGGEKAQFNIRTHDLTSIKGKKIKEQVNKSVWTEQCDVAAKKEYSNTFN